MTYPGNNLVSRECHAHRLTIRAGATRGEGSRRPAVEPVREFAAHAVTRFVQLAGVAGRSLRALFLQCPRGRATDFVVVAQPNNDPAAWRLGGSKRGQQAIEGFSWTHRNFFAMHARMKGSEFRSALEQLKVSQADFARLVDVTSRAVNSWATDEQGEVPGPVAAYARLLSALPQEQQFRELSRLKYAEVKMLDGLYKIEYAGTAGTGLGSLIFNQGRIQGADFGGVQYDGLYSPVPGDNCLNINVRATVPPGVWLVQGVPAQRKPYFFEIKGKIAVQGDTVVTVQTRFGSVNVKFEFLRGLDQLNALRN